MNLVGTANFKIVNVIYKRGKTRKTMILETFLKVEKILKGILNLMPSPSLSLKIQIMGGKVCLRSKGKALLGVVNKLLKIKSLLTMVKKWLNSPLCDDPFK